MTTNTTATVSPLGKMLQDKVVSQRIRSISEEHYTNSVDIEGAVYAVAIDALEALWLVKYGNEWVTDVQFNETFWEVAAERLRQMGRLEKHYLTDRACYVYRIPK